MDPHRARWAVVVGVAVALVTVAVVLGRTDGTQVGVGGSTSTKPSTTPSQSSSSRTASTAPTSSTAPTTTTVIKTTTSTLPPDGSAVVIRRGDPTRPTVALTFDAGSDLGSAIEILDYLAAQHISATFGVTGEFADAHPAVVQRMVREGHQLLNHSYDHPSFTGRSTGTAPLTRAERIDQLRRTDAAIATATGTMPTPWFRPPYGDEDASVREDVALTGYRSEVLWTLDSLGWRGLDPPSVVQRCLDGAENGAIFLFHVGAASTDWAALPEIVVGLRARGYSFSTIAGVL